MLENKLIFSLEVKTIAVLAGLENSSLKSVALFKESSVNIRS